MKSIEINKWTRKDYYEFFSKYDDPFFGIVSEINCHYAYEKCKKDKLSFFAYYLHKSLVAVNSIEEFKFRCINDEIIVFDNIHAATTIGRTDGSFGFSFISFNEDFHQFSKSLKKEIEEVQNSSGIRYLKDSSRHDVVHYSTIPWKHFTGLKHPGNFSREDSAPKIVFGKAYLKNNEWYLPVSITGHHGFVDGIHLAMFLECFENMMQNKLTAQ